MKKIRRYLLIAAAFILPLTHVAQADDSVSLIQAYKAKPADRPAFRAWLQKAGIKQFETWKKAGKIQNYLILFNPYVPNSQSDDVTLVVDFPNMAATAAWREIEKTMPGGLPAEALKLATPEPGVLTEIIGRVDSDPSVNPGKAAYQILKIKISAIPAYKNYVKNYTVPEMTKLKEEAHAISGFTSYLNREHTHATWDVMAVIQAPDMDTLVHADEAKPKVRAELADASPEFKTLMENKAKTRSEISVTNTEAIVAPH